jgi:hypothetical protein
MPKHVSYCPVFQGAEAFGLDALPLAEAATCVAELRRAGVLADRSHYLPTTDQTAESRSR